MFQNREEAGLLLAQKLTDYKDRFEAIVLAIPRGGVVVGEKIARILEIPLSILTVKKLGAPGNPELAIGAVAPDNVVFLDKGLISNLGVSQEYIGEEIRKIQKEIEEREKKYQISVRQLADQISTKTIILVDDGIATGATTLTAIKFIKEQSASWRTSDKRQLKIILAVPVIAKDTYDKLKSEVEKIIALEIPECFYAVGQFYREFPQVTDNEVIEYLKSPK